MNTQTAQNNNMNPLYEVLYKITKEYVVDCSTSPAEVAHKLNEMLAQRPGNSYTADIASTQEETFENGDLVKLFNASRTFQVVAKVKAATPKGPLFSIEKITISKKSDMSKWDDATKKKYEDFNENGVAKTKWYQFFMNTTTSDANAIKCELVKVHPKEETSNTTELPSASDVASTQHDELKMAS